MLHYNRQHVSSSTLLIFRRTNCIITASGIVTLCKWPYSMPVRADCSPLSPAYCTAESDDTRGCNNTIWPPEDEHSTARNLLGIIMWYIYCYRIKELCIKLVIWNKKCKVFYRSRKFLQKFVKNLHILQWLFRWESGVCGQWNVHKKFTN